MEVIFWIDWAVAVAAFIAWRNPKYAGPGGLVCISAILVALLLIGLRAWK